MFVVNEVLRLSLSRQTPAGGSLTSPQGDPLQARTNLRKPGHISATTAEAH
jgi:hypothetical protein